MLCECCCVQASRHAAQSDRYCCWLLHNAASAAAAESWSWTGQLDTYHAQLWTRATIIFVCHLPTPPETYLYLTCCLHRLPLSAYWHCWPCSTLKLLDLNCFIIPVFLSNSVNLNSKCYFTAANVHLCFSHGYCACDNWFELLYVRGVNLVFRHIAGVVFNALSVYLMSA